MKEKEGTKTVDRVEVFNFSEKSTPVRVQVINGEPWFVAKDIAEALGYSNPRKAINDHCKEKGVTFRDSLTEGGVQKLKYINEGKVYRLIINSNMPQSESFESWIFDEVLPSIRERGYYGTGHGDVRRCGVEGMLYRGMRLYPYRELLKALGMSARSGSAKTLRAPAGAGDQRAQAPQIYREKRFFLKKKCAGECTVLKFICMFAVLKLLSEDSEGCPNAPHEGIFCARERGRLYCGAPPRGMVVMAVPVL